ncbi:MAG: undecaprenyldiphospho-muramoylpentapeptide beta-N-acetylglucosaminyltransferase [Bacteroidales bacterium]|nr:undecaprenyldiphospho-muramoylpentapeptide beta-N-acetylglucosaminyltransferase [Bacteroidales bacterium]
MDERPRIIIGGGGTGGHIFPAISIANAIMTQAPEAEILFVGAIGRMEMQRVPAAGYAIKGLPVAGLDRKNMLRNIPVIIKLLRSQYLAKKIIQEFRPSVAVGVGGYASGPILKVAQNMGIHTLIQEQNSYAGVTNRLLAKKAEKICVAYEGMERFFDKDKIMLTGNPVRQNLSDGSVSREEAIRRFQLSPEKRTILILGGSLGARSINDCLIGNLSMLRESGCQFVWQTGKYYYDEVKARVESVGDLPMVHVTDFIADMSVAYRAADLVVSRAGAGSISEFCILRKPVVLVPSPNVAEDHQTKNALALVHRQAAILVRDCDAMRLLMPTALETVNNDDLLHQLTLNIGEMALRDSANVIATEVLRLATSHKEKSYGHQ